MTAAKWKAELEPLSAMVAAPLSWLWAEERTKAELESLVRAARKASQTNCWWATYRASRVILDEVPRVLANRAEKATK